MKKKSDKNDAEEEQFQVRVRIFLSFLSIIV